MGLIDLSLPIGPKTPGVAFKQWSHEAGPRILSRNARRLPGDSRVRAITNYLSSVFGSRRVKPEDLPDQCFLSNEFFTMSVHTGTHVDAPFHYGPQSAGAPAKTIMDLPLEWLRGPGIVIDGTKAGKTVTAQHIREQLDVLAVHSLEGIIPLIRTDSDLNAGTPAYYSDSVAIAPSAIDELLDRGSKVVGTDAWSLDPPARGMLESYFATRDSSYLWPSHMHGRVREFVTIECLTNLRRLPSKGFNVSAFPIALRDAGGAWTRAVAEVTRRP